MSQGLFLQINFLNKPFVTLPVKDGCQAESCLRAYDYRERTGLGSGRAQSQMEETVSFQKSLRSFAAINNRKLHFASVLLKGLGFLFNSLCRALFSCSFISFACLFFTL